MLKDGYKVVLRIQSSNLERLANNTKGYISRNPNFVRNTNPNFVRNANPNFVSNTKPNVAVKKILKP